MTDPAAMPPEQLETDDLRTLICVFALLAIQASLPSLRMLFTGTTADRQLRLNRVLEQIEADLVAYGYVMEDL